MRTFGLCALFVLAAAMQGGTSLKDGWKPPAFAERAASRAEGALRSRLEGSRARLKQSPFDLPFILADVSFSQKRIFTEYSGDISGRVLGVSAAEKSCGIPESWPVADLLRELARYQQPDGHFGAEQNLSAEVIGERDMPILWGNGRLLVALVEAYDAGAGPDSLAIAKRLGDYYLATDGVLDRPELVEKFGNYAAGFATCYFSGIEGLVGLSRAAKDRRYLAQAEKMARLMEQSSGPREQHSHGRLCALRGLLDLYEATGKRPYLDRVIGEQEQTVNRFLWPTGGISEMSVRTFHRSEGCTEADWLRLNLQLWRLTGRDKYLDAAEMTLRNELAVNQFPNGGFGHRVARIESGLMDGYFGVGRKETQEAYWCCSEHGPRALLTVPASAAASRGPDVYVNLYEPAECALKVGGQTVRLSVKPNEAGDEVALTMHLQRAAKLNVLLRVPGWCRGFRIEGEQPRMQGSRAVVARKWTDGSRLIVRLPMALHFRRDRDLTTPLFNVPAGGLTESGVLFKGPYLLAYPESAGRPRVSIKSPEQGAREMVPASSFSPEAGFRCRVDLTP